MLASGVQSTMGQQTYQGARTTGTWISAFMAGFLFLNFMTWIWQIILIVILMVVLMKYFKQPFKRAAWLTYIIQGTITMLVFRFFLDKVLKIGFGL